MSLFVSSLNSGSNGNCFYIGNKYEAVLIDAGISCRETERRMNRLNLSLKKVKAIFVSHEHADHINGIRTLVKKYQLPVYITNRTLEQGRIPLNESFNKTFTAYQPIKIGNLSVTAFPKYHDATDPHSFIISYNNTRVGVFTDIGLPCQHVIKHFKQCNAAFLESNYDEEMLDRGSYSYALKNRIRGGKGHLSNKQALKLFTEHRPAFMSHLFLSHLSHNNNCPTLVGNLFSRYAKHTEIIIASRYEETQVYSIANTLFNTERSVKRASAVSTVQLSLF